MAKFIILVSTVLLINGCGGGGSTPSGVETAEVQGLQLPTNLSILPADDGGAQTAEAKVSSVSAKSGTAKLEAVTTTANLLAFDDAGTDFSTDVAEVYVYDESMDALNMVNEIICFIGQTGASEMVNAGPYIALVNEDDCEQGENQSAAGETGQSSAGGETEFFPWVIESTRADNDSPQIVRLWIASAPDDDQREDPNILVEMTISEGVTDANPFGVFVMNFRGVVDGTLVGQAAGTEVEVMRGSLQSVENSGGLPQFRFFNLSGDELNPGFSMGFGRKEAVNVRLDDANGTGGMALTDVSESWTNEDEGFPRSRQESFAIAYNGSHFLGARDDNADSVTDALTCRTRDEFDVRSWRYNLYHAADGNFRGVNVVAGDRVELRSGFPFSYDTDNNGVGDAQGWIGYHGIWTESDAGLDDGQTIFRFDYDTDTTTEYQARISPGRMTRREAQTEKLAIFVGEEFGYWGPHPVYGIDRNWLVTVNENLDFVITSTLDWTNNGPELFDTIDHDNNPETAEVAVEAIINLVDTESLWFWSDTLGGDVVYSHDATVPILNRIVVFYAHNFVSANDAALFPAGTSSVTLYCYEQCLKGGLTQDDVDTAQFDNDLYYAYAGQPFTYTLSMNDGRVILTDDANDAVVSAVELDLTVLGNEWGINTGELLTEPLANTEELWRLYQQPLSYRWESGPNHWNVLHTVIDANGTQPVFDRPVNINYMHSQANDANDSTAWAGKRMLLNYEGPGDLHGFPYVQDGDDPDRWYPAATLADGVVLSTSATDFIVKAMEKEQEMRMVDVAECAGLDAEAVLTDPDLVLPTINDVGTVNFSLADKPEVVDAPAVIEGEVQIQVGQ